MSVCLGIIIILFIYYQTDNSIFFLYALQVIDCIELQVINLPMVILLPDILSENLTVSCPILMNRKSDNEIKPYC